jgi:hypothetical protein
MPKISSLVLSTDREVKAAKSRGDRAEFRIKNAKNLVLRISRSGTKTWAFLYASPSTGNRCKISLGEYPTVGLAKAKGDALELMMAIRHGKDPLAMRRAEKAAETFEVLANRYMEEHVRKNTRSEKKSRWSKEVQRLLDADILPLIGAHKAEAITKQHVMGVVEAVADRGAYAIADKVLALIRAIYNWANSTGRLDINPTFGLKKRNAGRPRERTLSKPEICTLWHALEAPSNLSPEIRDALRLQLLVKLAWPRWHTGLKSASTSFSISSPAGTSILTTVGRPDHREPSPGPCNSPTAPSIPQATSLGKDTFRAPSGRPLGYGRS